MPQRPCGQSAWFSTDNGIDLVLISVRQQVFNTEIFTGLDIDFMAKQGIVVTSS